MADLIADLTPARRVGIDLRSALTLLTGHFRGEPPKRSTLLLPDRNNPVLVIGRRADCDVVLSDTTVSRVHAVLMLFGGQWLIHDRQSTNGTRVNGRRIWGATAIQPGDRVSFGRMTFRLVPPTVVDRDTSP